MSSLEIRPISDGDRPTIAALIKKLWGSHLVVTRGRVHDAGSSAGFLAMEGSKTVGLLTLRTDGDECEILTVDAFAQGKGIGRALLDEAFRYAKTQGRKRVWLITTNNNLAAIAFYQKCGMRMVAIYPDAVTEARKLKPQIPLVADNGIAIRDEVEFEVEL